jgi:hypothetical protein
LSENVRLTQKQIRFLLEWLEEEIPEKAAEKFMELMVLERVDPSEISFVLDKIIAKRAWEKK